MYIKSLGKRCKNITIEIMSIAIFARCQCAAIQIYKRQQNNLWCYDIICYDKHVQSRASAAPIYMASYQ